MTKIIKNKKAESLVGIIVGVFILSFVLLGIGNLIGNSRETISQFDEQMQIDILSKNAAKIIDNLDLSTLNNGDIFYIYKNPSTKQFEIKTNNLFSYIDHYGNKINDINNFNGKIFERKIKLSIIDISGINSYHTDISINLLNK